MSEKRKSFMIGGFNAVAVVDSEGNRKPLPIPGVVTMPQSRSSGADKTYRLGALDFSMTFEASPETFAFFDNLPKPEQPNALFKLAEDGKVLIDGSRVGINSVPLAKQWYFIDMVDRQVWRYSLRTGMQLEDAVAYLNRLDAKELR